MRIDHPCMEIDELVKKAKGLAGVAHREYLVMQWAGTIIARCVLISAPASSYDFPQCFSVNLHWCKCARYGSELVRATTMRGSERRWKKRREPTSEGAGLTARPSG